MLAISVRKGVTWIKIETPSGDIIKLAIKDHSSTNKKLGVIVFDAKKEIKINRISNDADGNK